MEATPKRRGGPGGGGQRGARRRGTANAGRTGEGGTRRRRARGGRWTAGRRKAAHGGGPRRTGRCGTRRKKRACGEGPSPARLRRGRRRGRVCRALGRTLCAGENALQGSGLARARGRRRRTEWSRLRTPRKGEVARRPWVTGRQLGRGRRTRGTGEAGGRRGGCGRRRRRVRRAQLEAALGRWGTPVQVQVPRQQRGRLTRRGARVRTRRAFARKGQLRPTFQTLRHRWEHERRNGSPTQESGRGLPRWQHHWGTRGRTSLRHSQPSPGCFPGLL